LQQLHVALILHHFRLQCLWRGSIASPVHDIDACQYEAQLSSNGSSRCADPTAVGCQAGSCQLRKVATVQLQAPQFVHRTVDCRAFCTQRVDVVKPFSRFAVW
jgi:hypothetical protein